MYQVLYTFGLTSINSFGRSAIGKWLFICLGDGKFSACSTGIRAIPSPMNNPSSIKIDLSACRIFKAFSKFKSFLRSHTISSVQVVPVKDNG